MQKKSNPSQGSFPLVNKTMVLFKVPNNTTKCYFTKEQPANIQPFLIPANFFSFFTKNVNLLFICLILQLIVSLPLH